MVPAAAADNGDDAHRAAGGEEYAAPPLQAILLTPADAKLRDSIEIEITNVSSLERDVWPELSAGGLADVQTTRRYPGRLLAPGETTVLRVPAGELPLRTAVIPITTVLSVGYASDTGLPGSVVVGDLITSFDGDLTHVAIATQGTAGFERSVDLSAAKAGLVARVFDAQADAFVDLDESALELQHDVHLVSETAELDAVDDLPEGSESSAAPSFNKATSSSFCARIRYGFSDAGFGEDRLTAKSGGLVNAAFVRVNVLRGSTMVFQGFLNANGCTPSVSTPAGSYTVRIFSRVGRDGKELWAFDNNADTSLAAFSSTVNVSASTSSVLTVTPPVTFDYGAFLALASTAVSVFPESLSGRVDFRINQNCTISPACADPDGNFLTIGGDASGRFITQKFVVGHELGHIVQRRNWGNLAFKYDLGLEIAPFCACDHVDASRTNDKHCLQSREEASAAQNEGFGHFYAARLFNVANQGSDCTFVYAKEWLNPDLEILPAPVALSCSDTWAWNTDVCGGGNADTGVELDWMVFYWKLITRSPSFDFASLRLLYRRACSPTCSGDASCATACQSKRVNGLTLEATAASIWGFGSAQHGHVATHVWENL